MSRYLNTRGRASIAIAVCDRCHKKVPYSELRSDGNSPGLKVCNDRGCFDIFDPWRLPARQPEKITLRNPRPDRRIGFSLVFLVDEYGSNIIAENGDFIITEDREDL